jgi:membrane protease YdiL (CAAX protease family)
LDAVSQKEDPLFDGRTTVTLIGGQSLLIVVAAVAALIFQTPNFGLGSGISFNKEALTQGALYSIPLFVLAFLLDTIEDKYPALQDVTKATQRSVIALLGGTFKPLLALTTSIVLGVVAGFGEEMLFRGVLQYELASSLDFGSILAVGASSLVFGALHAVTPLYALLATLASVFFGLLYQGYDNLAVPISTHAVYDVGALLWAHWTVTQMSSEERDEIVKWNGPQ